MFFNKNILLLAIYLSSNGCIGGKFFCTIQFGDRTNEDIAIRSGATGDYKNRDMMDEMRTFFPSVNADDRDYKVFYAISTDFITYGDVLRAYNKFGALYKLPTIFRAVNRYACSDCQTLVKDYFASIQKAYDQVVSCKGVLNDIDVDRNDKIPSTDNTCLAERIVQGVRQGDRVFRATGLQSLFGRAVSNSIFAGGANRVLSGDSELEMDSEKAKRLWKMHRELRAKKQREEAAREERAAAAQEELVSKAARTESAERAAAKAQAAAEAVRIEATRAQAEQAARAESAEREAEQAKQAAEAVRIEAARAQAELLAQAEQAEQETKNLMLQMLQQSIAQNKQTLSRQAKDWIRLNKRIAEIAKDLEKHKATLFSLREYTNESDNALAASIDNALAMITAPMNDQQMNRFIEPAMDSMSLKEYDSFLIERVSENTAILEDKEAELEKIEDSRRSILDELLTVTESVRNSRRSSRATSQQSSRSVSRNGVLAANIFSMSQIPGSLGAQAAVSDIAWDSVSDTATEFATVKPTSIRSDDLKTTKQCIASVADNDAITQEKALDADLQMWRMAWASVLPAGANENQINLFDALVNDTIRSAVVVSLHAQMPLFVALGIALTAEGRDFNALKKSLRELFPNHTFNFDE